MERRTIGFAFAGALLVAGGAGPVASVCVRLDSIGLAAPASNVRSDASINGSMDRSANESMQAPAQQGRAGGAAGAPQGGRGGGRGTVAVMSLTTTGWTDGGTVALKYSQAGDEVSPPLAWNGQPNPTTSFVLMVRDIDAMRGNDDTLHWLVWNIPGTATGLPEKVPQGPELPDGTRQISATGPYYRGPAAPATGPAHHYVFELYALDAMIDVQPTPGSPAEIRTAVMAAMAGHIRGKASLVGLFKRAGVERP